MLGGGLAYRFFFWVLALSVLIAGGLGFASASGTDVAANSREAGMTRSLAATVATAAEQSEARRWWLVLAGSVLVLWSSYGLLRALHLVQAAAWRMTPPPLRNLPKALAVVLAVPVVLFLLSTGAGWARANSARPVGILVTVGVGILVGAIWLWISWNLPAPEGVPWTAFVPGAVLLTLGFQALYVFAVYFLQARLANATELYGVLGLATTALFYLFLVGRGVVWAAELNAVAWVTRAAPTIGIRSS